MRRRQKIRILLFLVVFIVMIAGLFEIYQFFGRLMVQAEGGVNQPPALATIADIATTTVAPISAPVPVSSTTPVPTRTATTTLPGRSLRPKPSLEKPKPVVASPLEPPTSSLSSDQRISLAFSLDSLSSIVALLDGSVNSVIVQNAVATSAPPTLAPTSTSTMVLVAAPAVATTTAATGTTAPPPPSALSPPPAFSYEQNGFSDLSGWERTWGAVTVASDSLQIGAARDSTGGEAVLSELGGDQATNYRFTATVDWIAGRTFSLEAHRKDSNDYLSCEFLNDGEVYDYMMVNGLQTQLGQGLAPNFTPARPATVSIGINNGQIQCGMDGAVVPQQVYYGIPPVLASGDVGILAWDLKSGVAHIAVSSVLIVPL